MNHRTKSQTKTFHSWPPKLMSYSSIILTHFVPVTQSLNSFQREFNTTRVQSLCLKSNRVIHHSVMIHLAANSASAMSLWNQNKVSISKLQWWFCKEEIGQQIRVTLLGRLSMSFFFLFPFRNTYNMDIWLNNGTSIFHIDFLHSLIFIFVWAIS